MSNEARTQVWLVRHGATQWSQAGRYTSVTDLPLLPQGRIDAEQAGALLARERFDLVLASPRLRALQAARLAGIADPEVDDDLVEWGYGPAEGLTSEQIRERVPGWRIWTHGAPSFDRDEPYPAGESRAQVVARLGRVVERARESGAGKVLLFGHGHALRCLAMLWLGFPVEHAAHFPLATGSVSVLGYEKESPALVAWNVGGR